MSAATLRQRGAAKPSSNVKPDDVLLKVANWLREPKRSGVLTREAVQYERRVEYFKGAKLMEALTSDKFKNVKGFPAIKSRVEAAALANKLIAAQYFHRSQRVYISARRWELEMHPTHTFEEQDGLYTWIHDGSKGRLYLLCALTLAGALMLCMVQIWPIWMKIGLWWCSVTFLTTFSALCAVRLMLFCVMFAVGFRGIWLFPNLFDDNQTFTGSFMPIMGKAEPVTVADEYDSDDDELRRFRSKKKTDAADASADSDTPVSPVAKRTRKAATDEDPTWKFGLINVAILGAIGLVACWNMGFFDGENVPDFVAKHDDLTFYFPTIAPPENVSTSAGGAGAAPDDGTDPFAAPADDNEKY